MGGNLLCKLLGSLHQQMRMMTACTPQQERPEPAGARLGKWLQEQGEGAPCWSLGAQEGSTQQQDSAHQGGPEPSRGAGQAEEMGIARVRGSSEALPGAKGGAEGTGGIGG